jgi:hypothetical protein
MLFRNWEGRGMDAPTEERRPKQSFIVRLLRQLAAALVILLLTGLIHYQVRPLNSVDTAGGAFILALSCFPGIIIGYAIVAIQRRSGDDDPDVPVAALICALLWFVYLFRGLTLLLGLPGLSNWIEGPVDVLVKGIEWMDPDKLGNWLFGLAGS